MLPLALNIATPEPCDRVTSVQANASYESSAPRVRTASELRSPIDKSASANIPTAINPASPAHGLRGRAGERSPQAVEPKFISRLRSQAKALT